MVTLVAVSLFNSVEDIIKNCTLYKNVVSNTKNEYEYTY